VRHHYRRWFCRRRGLCLSWAHYYVAGLTTDVSGVESVDGWVNDQENDHHVDVRRLKSADLTLNAAELKGAHHRVYYFGSHYIMPPKVN
jgi:hypothetical protein